MVPTFQEDRGFFRDSMLRSTHFDRPGSVLAMLRRSNGLGQIIDIHSKQLKEHAPHGAKIP